MLKLKIANKPLWGKVSKVPNPMRPALQETEVQNRPFALVYYGCTKFKDKNCPCGCVREEELIEQLANILDVVSLNEIGMKDNIKAEIESHNEFQESVLGKKVNEKIRIKDIDIRNYAKHILRKRSLYEKRELLKHLRSKLILKEKQIVLVK